MLGTILEVIGTVYVIGIAAIVLVGLTAPDSMRSLIDRLTR